MLSLLLTAFPVVPISTLLHCVPGKQKDLPKVPLILNGIRMLKRDGRKILLEQAWYL